MRKKDQSKIYILIAILFIVAITVLVIYRHNQKVARIAREKEAASQLREEKTMKIIEGWNDKQIAEELDKIEHPAAISFLDAVSAPTAKEYYSDFSFLADKPESADLEGYLFPDTYRIYASSTADEIVYKLLSNFDKKLTPQMRSDIAKQGKSIYQILTMASLVEKEAAVNQGGKNDDAKIVAGIFWDRIKYGQLLQSCATLAYILGVNKPIYSLADTRVDSPYNTYMHQGLPPGPIANPGIEAIKAAIYPIYTEYNYFLTPTGSSSLVFSKTLEEHNRNKQKYLSD